MLTVDAERSIGVEADLLRLSPDRTAASRRPLFRRFRNRSAAAPMRRGDRRRTLRASDKPQRKEDAMSLDNDLAADVSDELFWDPKVDNTAIAVSADDGKITLRGTVGSLREKHEAKKAAQRVFGVHLGRRQAAGEADERPEARRRRDSRRRAPGAHAGQPRPEHHRCEGR